MLRFHSIRRSLNNYQYCSCDYRHPKTLFCLKAPYFIVDCTLRLFVVQWFMPAALLVIARGSLDQVNNFTIDA